MHSTTAEPDEEPGEKRPRHLESAEVLEKLLDLAKGTLDREELKMSLADLIRLLQWQEQSKESEKAREIEVRWVEEPSMEQPTGEKRDY